MALTTRVFGAGKLLVLGGALLGTFFVFALVGMRFALRTSEVVVPDLASRTVNEASALLADRGLTLRVDEARRQESTIEAGLIMAQDPPAGVTARRQRSVRVWISGGPRVAMVPPLVGESERAAQMRLQQDQLELVEIAEIRSGEYPPDAVVAQEPPPNSQGTRVSVLLNRGERGATYVMPDLIGVSAEHASDILRARGFRVAVVSSQPYPGLPPGIVLRQHPQAGFQIEPGEPISLEVSR